MALFFFPIPTYVAIPPSKSTTSAKNCFPGGSAYKDISSVENQEERTDVSLITGRVRKLGHEQVSHDSDSGSMALAHRDDMAVSTAAGTCIYPYNETFTWATLTH